jgi:hypothetical protein
MLRYATRLISRTTARRLVAFSTAVAFAVVATGCYNTYSFKREEFAKLQWSDTPVAVVMSKGGNDVAVDSNTSLYVRSWGGRRYPISAFNFKLTESQLVASDRDTLLMVNELESYEVDHLSTWKTVLLITAGAAAVAGIIVGVFASADDKTEFNQ